jgi:hypothetical protein
LLLPSQLAWDMAICLMGIDPVNGSYTDIKNIFSSPTYGKAIMYSSFVDMSFGIVVEIVTCILLRSIFVGQMKTISLKFVGFFELGLMASGLYGMILATFYGLNFELSFTVANLIATYRLFSAFTCASMVNSMDTVKQEVIQFNSSLKPSGIQTEDCVSKKSNPNPKSNPDLKQK